VPAMVSPALRPSTPFPVLDVAPEVVAVPSVVDPSQPSGGEQSRH